MLETCWLDDADRVGTWDVLVAHLAHCILEKFGAGGWAYEIFWGHIWTCWRNCVLDEVHSRYTWGILDTHFAIWRNVVLEERHMRHFGSTLRI